MTFKFIGTITPDNRKHLAVKTMNLDEGWTLKAYPPGRNLDQNAAQWPILAQFSKEFMWPVNGEMSWLQDTEWKDILTAAFEKEVNMRLAAGWDGGVVMLGQRTRKYSKSKFSEWLDFLNAAYAEMKHRHEQQNIEYEIPF